MRRRDDVEDALVAAMNDMLLPPDTRSYLDTALAKQV